MEEEGKVDESAEEAVVSVERFMGGAQEWVEWGGFCDEEDLEGEEGGGEEGEAFG